MHCKTQKGKYNLWQKERGVSGWDTTKQNNISISRVVTLILIEYVVDQMPISSYVYLWTCVCFTCQGKSCHPLTIKGFNLEDYPREKWPTHSHSCWVKYYHDSGVNHSGILVRPRRRQWVISFLTNILVIWGGSLVCIWLVSYSSWGFLIEEIREDLIRSGSPPSCVKKKRTRFDSFKKRTHDTNWLYVVDVVLWWCVAVIIQHWYFYFPWW